MPCSGNLSTREVLRDLNFWKDHEETFEDTNWTVLFACSYVVMCIVIWQKLDNATYRLTRDSLVHLKTLTAAFFVGFYISIPLFFAFPSLRTIFFMTHFLCLHGASTTLRMCNQPDEYQIIIKDNEYLGYIRSFVVASVFIFVQVVHTITAPRSRYYECPESWLVTWEDVTFKLFLLNHIVGYFMIKSVWLVYRIENFLIYRGDELVGNLVKRNGRWVEERLTKNQ